MRPRLVITLLALVAFGALAGCGQKGPLSMPPVKPAGSQPAPPVTPVAPAATTAPAMPATSGSQPASAFRSDSN